MNFPAKCEPSAIEALERVIAELRAELALERRRNAELRRAARAGSRLAETLVRSVFYARGDEEISDDEDLEAQDVDEEVEREMRGTAA